MDGFTTGEVMSRLFYSVSGVVFALALAAGCAPPPPDDPDPEADGYVVPKTPDGDPDFNGIWQALGAAHWDLEDHAARQGPAPLMGALGAIPAGRSVVVGGTIPYTPEALAQRDENRADWVRRDPAVKCYMPGIPRATYMPFPFQFVQSKDAIFAAYEFTSSTRIIHLDRPGTEAELPAWMGYSLGRFEGDTLVVDVTAQVADTWFDSSGNFHTADLKVTERYTRTGPGYAYSTRRQSRIRPSSLRRGRSACRCTGGLNPVRSSSSSSASSSRNTRPSATCTPKACSKRRPATVANEGD